MIVPKGKLLGNRDMNTFYERDISRPDIGKTLSSHKWSNQVNLTSARFLLNNHSYNSCCIELYAWQQVGSQLLHSASKHDSKTEGETIEILHLLCCMLLSIQLGGSRDGGSSRLSGHRPGNRKVLGLMPGCGILLLLFSLGNELYSHCPSHPAVKPGYIMCACSGHS